MELNKREQYTKEQLTEHAQLRNKALKRLIADATTDEASREYYSRELAYSEIALAVLTAPDDVPSHVENGICHMSDGGVNAQGIWELCKSAVMGGAQ